MRRSQPNRLAGANEQAWRPWTAAAAPGGPRPCNLPGSEPATTSAPTCRCPCRRAHHRMPSAALSAQGPPPCTDRRRSPTGPHPITCTTCRPLLVGAHKQAHQRREPASPMRPLRRAHPSTGPSVTAYGSSVGPHACCPYPACTTSASSCPAPIHRSSATVRGPAVTLPP